MTAFFHRWPMSTGLGPNRYLSHRAFLGMLALAALVHGVAMFVAAMIPPAPVTPIPVRALSFKLGETLQAVPVIRAPVIEAVAAPPPAPTIPTAPVFSPPALPKPAPTKPKPTPIMKPISERKSSPAIAPTPQQFVRDVAAPSLPPSAADLRADNAVSSPAEQAVQTIRLRYETILRSWVARHYEYPPELAGAQGTVTLRLQIDRTGAMRYSAIEQSSGNALIDAAALAIVRRANPMPPVPADFPPGNLIGILLPITFKEPP